jgi:hypothetical protein
MAIAAVCQPDAARPLNMLFLCSDFVEMHGLRIKFRRETLDIAFSDLNLTAFEVHP